MSINIFKKQPSYGEVSGDPASISEVILNTPVGLVKDANNNIWIADTGDNRVIIVSSDFSEVLYTIDGLKKSMHGNDSFNMPFRMTHYNNKVYLSDMGNDCVLEVSYPVGSGEYNKKTVKSHKSYGKFGFDKGELNGANGVAVFCINEQEFLAVSDEFSDEETVGMLKIFDLETRKEVASFDRLDATTDIFWPQGLCTDDTDNLYVCNTGTNQVFKCRYNPDTKELEKVNFANGTPFLSGIPGVGFFTPRAISIIGNKIYVADNGLTTIAVFDLDGNYLDKIDGFFYNSGAYVFLGPVGICASPTSDDCIIASVIILDATYAGGVLYGNGCYPVTVELNTAAMFTIQGKRYATATKLAGSSRRTSNTMFSYPSAVVKNLDEDIVVLDSYNFKFRIWEQNNSSKEYSYKNSYDIIRMTGVLFAGTSVEYYGVETGSGKIERYFVSYASYGQIFVFDGNFTHISTFATPGTGEDNLYFPSGMHAKYNDDNTCDLYIADSYNNRISVWKYTPDAANPLNDSSSHLVNYGSIGVNPGQFIYPTDVSLSSSGGIYVADMNNNRVQYTTDTTTWHTIGEKGYEAPDLFLPIGVTVSSASGSELLYVVDLLNRAIKVYSLDGDFLYSYPIKGKDPRYNYPNALGFLKGQMWMPFGCFTDGKFVHLPDSALSRVNVYKLS